MKKHSNWDDNTNWNANTIIITGYVTNEAEWGTLEREIRAERKKMLDKAFNDEMRRLCDSIRRETQE